MVTCCRVMGMEGGGACPQTIYPSLSTLKGISGNFLHPHYEYSYIIRYTTSELLTYSNTYSNTNSNSTRLPQTTPMIFADVIGSQQACSHCHVESSPQRKEMATREVAERCMEVSLFRQHNLDCRNHLSKCEITNTNNISNRSR